MASSLVPEADRQLLLALLRTDIAVSGRALARMTGLSQPSAQRALVRLREAGLVLTESAPPALLYRANRDHLALPAISELLRLDERLRERLAKQVTRWAVRPVSVVLYGSVARGEAGTGSDVDVLVVRPDAVSAGDPVWAEQLSVASDSIGRWTGRRASVVELGETEARRGLRRGEPFLAAAAEEGLVIWGEALRELTAPRRR
jgi:DNA-binding transcriptional ArsR family regulator